MSKQSDAVLADLDTLIQVWEKEANLVMGDLTLPMVKAKRDELSSKDKLVDETRTTLSRLIDEAGDVRAEGDQLMSRGRSGIRAAFGADSPQYAQVRGTRVSERKPRSKKKGPGKPSGGDKQP
jgi:hypothetical protein